MAQYVCEFCGGIFFDANNCPFCERPRWPKNVRFLGFIERSNAREFGVGVGEFLGRTLEVLFHPAGDHLFRVFLTRSDGGMPDSITGERMRMFLRGYRAAALAAVLA